MTNPNDENWRGWVNYPLLQALLSGAAELGDQFTFTAKPDKAGFCAEVEAELAELIGIDAQTVPITILAQAMLQMRTLGRWASNGYVLLNRGEKLKAFYILGEEY